MPTWNGKMKRQLGAYKNMPTSTGIYKKKKSVPSKKQPVYRSKYYAPNQNLPEKKFFDTTLAFAIDSTAETGTTAVLGQIDLIPQGDTESTRDGRQVTIDSISIKGLLTFDPAASADASGVTYICLVQDMQANGAQAAITDIFTTSTLVNQINMSNAQRFKILKKWTHEWNPLAGATGAYNTENRFIDYYMKCNIPLDFSAGTGAITELKSNHIFLAYGSNAAIDDLVAFAGISRLRFRG